QFKKNHYPKAEQGAIQGAILGGTCATVISTFGAVAIGVSIATGPGLVIAGLGAVLGGLFGAKTNK
ncbi:MAG TPA: hypothetical protein DCQ37_02270, partial [Desulfobacteraceae bacterium]|nr:hypothetical protein [Desulfobacteraceae bacterium]